MNHQFTFNLFKDLQLSSPLTGKFPCFEIGLGLAGLSVPCSLKAPLEHRVRVVTVGDIHTHLKSNAALQLPPNKGRDLQIQDTHFSKLHSLRNELINSFSNITGKSGP